jgi:hypothetical protein
MILQNFISIGSRAFVKNSSELSAAMFQMLSQFPAMPFNPLRVFSAGYNQLPTPKIINNSTKL